MVGCNANHSAPVRLASVLVRIDVPHATTMTTGCPKGTRNRFADTFPPLCGRSPHSLVLHSVLLRIVQGWLDPDEVARWPGGEVFLSDQGTDNLFHLTVAEDVLHRVVC